MDADHRPPGGLPDLMPSPQLELQLGPQQLEVSKLHGWVRGVWTKACWAGQGRVLVAFLNLELGAWGAAVGPF